LGCEVRTRSEFSTVWGPPYTGAWGKLPLLAPPCWQRYIWTDRWSCYMGSPSVASSGKHLYEDVWRTGGPGLHTHPKSQNAMLMTPSVWQKD